jgi:hypothetical protein
MSEADKDLQRAVDDHLKRLYERYKSNAKVFTATHIGHVVLSIVFVLSILIPFLCLQIDARATNSELEQLSLGIARQEQRAATYRQAMASLKKVFDSVEDTPKPLEGYIRALEQEAAGGPVAPLPGGPAPGQETCGSSADKDAWMECRLRQYMAARAAQSQEILANEIAAPLARLEIKEFDQWKADLQAGMQKHAERIRSRMAATPGFWKDFNQQAPIYQSMIEGVHRFWADHQFEEIGRRMEQAAAAGRAGVEQLNQKKEQIQKGRESLNNALKSIKTRFGKLGLEVEDAILLAPVAFAALFLFAALNLCQNMQLRKSFHRLFQARDPRKVALTDSEIALAMPLWIDPLAPPMQRKLKFAVLLIPALASALTLPVVFYCWAMPDAFPGLAGPDRVKYILYYLVAAGVFVIGFGKIRDATRGYGDPCATSEQTTP